MTALLKLFRTTSFKLALIFAALFGTAALLVIGYVSWASSRLLEQRITETILAETHGLAEQYQASGVKELARVINRRIKLPSNAIYLLTDPRGRRIAGNVSSVTSALWKRRGPVKFAYHRKGPGGMELRHADARIFPLARGYRMMVGRDVEDQRRFARLIRDSVIYGLVFMLLAGLAGGWLMSRKLLRRIDAITGTSRSIMAGDMSRRVPVEGTGDELDRLSINLNAMLERIEQLMNGLREVSDNIAHDLKTPLNRMRGHVEAALRGTGEDNCRAALEQTIVESDELIHTFNALLSIAKFEAGTGSDSFHPHDLREILQDVVELYEPLAEEKGLELIFSNNESLANNGSLANNDPLAEGDRLVLSIDRQLMAQAVANLVENAIKYASRDTPGVIRLEVGREHAQKERVYISVADNGPGIPASQYERALRRFGRLEASRSQPGTGLGLSLVAAVARLHGGSLRLEDNKPGLKARITLSDANGSARALQTGKGLRELPR